MMLWSKESDIIIKAIVMRNAEVVPAATETIAYSVLDTGNG